MSTITAVCTSYTNGIPKNLRKELSTQQIKDIEKFQTYLEVEKEFSANTAMSYATSISFYFKKYPDISKDNLLEFKKDLIARLKYQTVNLRIRGVNAYLEWKKLDKLKIKGVKEDSRSHTDNIITEKEYQKFITFLKDNYPKEAFFVSVLAQTGARISEALALRKEDFILGYVDIKSKTGMRRIHIPKKIMNEHKDYFDSTDKLFHNRYGDRITSRGMASLLKIRAEQCGIPKEHVFPHSFRHFFAKQILKRSKNLALTADLLGHKNISTTAIYLRMSSAEQSKQLNKLMDW